MIKTSYPLAVIARHYKLDYSQVLFTADYLRVRGDELKGRIAYNTIPLIVLSHINDVVSQHQMMQQGQLDWNERHVLIL